MVRKAFHFYFVFATLVGFFCFNTTTLIVVLSKAYQATKMDIWKHLKYE
jgi:hypothetical protein